MTTVVTVKANREYSIIKGHPWVFSGALESIAGIEEGAAVEVRDRGNNLLGVGHFSSVGSIAVRILGLAGDGRDEQEILRKRLLVAIELRDRLGLMRPQSTTTGYRLVHGEGDNLPGLVIDRYGSLLVVQCHTFGMYRNREVIAQILQEAFSTQIEAIFCKSSASLPGKREGEFKDHFLYGTTGESSLLVNGLTFQVNVVEGQKTGMYLDQRENWERVAALTTGRSVLNLFCYTGGFTVHAARAGAASIVSVDRVQDPLDRLARHLEINQLSVDHTEIKDDCLHFLEQETRSFDVVIVDPPAFAKHKSAIEGARRGYEGVNRSAIRRIPAGGVLATFSCSQLVSAEMFKECIEEALRKERRSGKIIGKFTQASCHPVGMAHPEGDYLKGLFIALS